MIGSAVVSTSVSGAPSFASDMIGAVSAYHKQKQKEMKVRNRK